MKKPRRLVSKPESGFFSRLGIQARLLWRLMQDSRISFFLKLLPIASFLYLLFPFDLLGPIDDALVIWLGSTLFIELSPPEVVQEHRAELEPITKKKEEIDPSIKEENIIDAEFRE